MQNFNKRKKFPSVSKETDQQCRSGICQSFFSLMKTLNPGAQKVSTLIFVKLTWSIDGQFSSLWLGKSYTYTDQHTNWLFYCQLLSVISCGDTVLPKSSYWDKNSRKPADGLCAPDVRLSSLL